MAECNVLNINKPSVKPKMGPQKPGIDPDLRVLQYNILFSLLEGSGQIIFNQV